MLLEERQERLQQCNRVITMSYFETRFISKIDRERERKRARERSMVVRVYLRVEEEEKRTTTIDNENIDVC